MDIGLDEVFGDEVGKYDKGWRFLTVDSKGIVVLHKTHPYITRTNGDTGEGHLWRSAHVMMHVHYDTTEIVNSVRGLYPEQMIFNIK